jgi:hypothetical protein
MMKRSIVILFVLISFTVLSCASGPKTFIVKAIPEGSKIYVNGELKGVDKIELDKGNGFKKEYNLKVTHDGYSSKEKTIVNKTNWAGPTILLGLYAILGIYDVISITNSYNKPGNQDSYRQLYGLSLGISGLGALYTVLGSNQFEKEYVIDISD